MQNIETSELQLKDRDQSSLHPNWYMLWLKKWNYSHWLITSVISALVLSEIVAVVLSAYPNLLTYLWLSLGITSSLTIGILSGLALISLALVMGWLVYACHQAFQASKSLELDYEPLVKLWSINDGNYGFIFKKLLQDDNFLALSNYIKFIPEARGLHDYLQNSTNADLVRKVLTLLDKLWSTEAIEQQSKHVAVHFLSKYMQTTEAEAHIDNISALCKILWENKEPNHQLFVKVIENSSLLKPHLKELQAVSSDIKQLSEYINDPSLIRTTQPILSLAVGEFKHDNDEPISSIEQHSTAAMHIKKILAQYYEKNPAIIDPICLKLTKHPQLEIIELLIQALSSLKDGTLLLADQSALVTLLDISFAGVLTTDIDNIKELASKLFVLNAFTVFTPIIVDKKPLALSLELLNAYQLAIQDTSKVSQDLNQLLIDNQDIIDKFPDTRARSATDIEKIVADTFKNKAQPSKRNSMFSIFFPRAVKKPDQPTVFKPSI